MLVVERATGFGDTCWWSMRSRAGDETCAICIRPVPLGQPVAGDVGAAVTMLVALDTALADPSVLLAVTRTRMRKPTSAASTRYVLLVALGIASQFEPFAAPPSFGQRSQPYANVVGESDQVPFEAVSVSPSTGVPRMFGPPVFVGAVCDCAEPAAGSSAAASPTTATSGNTSRSARRARMPFPLK